MTSVADGKQQQQQGVNGDAKNMNIGGNGGGGDKDEVLDAGLIMEVEKEDSDGDGDGDGEIVETMKFHDKSNALLASADTTETDGGHETNRQQSPKQTQTQNPFFLILFFISTTLIAMLLSSSSSPSASSSSSSSASSSSYSASYYILYPVYRLIMNIAGTAIGIGLGLGLALHVRELLDEASYNHSHGIGIGIDADADTGTGTDKKGQVLAAKKNNNRSIPSPFQRHYNTYNNYHNDATASSTTIAQSSSFATVHDDGTNNMTSSSTYHTLMANAGYAIPKNLLRGQIIRNISGGSGGSGSVLDCYTGEHTNNIPKRSSLYHFPTVKNINISSNANDAKDGASVSDNTNTNTNTNINNENNNSKGKVTFQKMWPNLPLDVQAELGTLIDYIVRDYITSWYCYVDSGVQYENAKEVQQRMIREQQQQQQQQQQHLKKSEKRKKGGGDAPPSIVQNASSQSTSPVKGDQEDDAEDYHHQQQQSTSTSAMVLSTSASRTIPFLEILYTSLTSLFGNFAMCVGDNINITELVLIKLIHILKVNIKMYRYIRKAVLLKEEQRLQQEQKEQKQQKQHSHGNHNYIDSENTTGGSGGTTSLPSEGDKVESTPTPTPPATKATNTKIKPVSEIAIVKEYLVQGKLHRAITFGMDVPGLLFGDMNGEECPPPGSYNDFVNHSRGDTVKMNENNCESGKDVYNNNNDNNNAIEDPTRRGNKSRKIIADEILRRRLFGNKSRILYECELDYNRVLSQRIVRILFQRADFNSPILRSAVVEMLASCVITPVMGCFTPDYVNGWIIAGLEDTSVVASSGVDNMEIFDGGDIDDDDDDDDDDLEQSDDEDTLLDEDHEYGDDEATHDEEIENVDQVQATDVGFSHGDVNLSITITNSADATYMDPSDEILALLSMSLIEIGAYVDYDEARIAKETGQELEVDWNDKGCKEVVRNLVLVIESVLVHGLLQKPRLKKKKEEAPIDEDNLEIADNLSPQPENYAEHSSLITLLMEVTSDLESFENKMKSEIGNTDKNGLQDEFLLNDEPEVHLIPKPNMTDLSTLRTLIAAWLHTGLVYRTISVLIQNGAEFLFPFYHEEAFILDMSNSSAFLRQLRTLHEVELIVDLGTVIPCTPLNLFQVDKLGDANPSSFFPPTLVEDSSTEQQEQVTLSPKTSSSKGIMKLTRGLQPKGIPGIRSIKANFESNKKKLSSFVRVGVSNDRTSVRQSSPTHQQQPNDNSSIMRPLSTSQEVPSHLNFRKNEVFATSLRNERESRMKSFANVFNSPRSNAEMICRSRISSEAHFLEHKDLHNLAKCFYSNTNALILKSDLRRSNNSRNKDETHQKVELALVLETIAARRKMRIPEDDSAFLLRAQPSPLDVVSIHRDQRSNSLSYKKYIGYYDEPVLHLPSMVDRGARLRRKCFIRYYPNDRTASITFIQSDRRVDFHDKEQRKVCILLMGVEEGNRPKEFERHPCYKAVRKGTERTTGTLANSILASTLMDSGDFTSVPRSGRASDFLYRMTLFEEPAIELSGKHIIVQDAAAVGCHQADASSLELSDASLSTAILIGSNEGSAQFQIRCDSVGSPVVFLKVIENPSALGSKTVEKKNSLVYRSFRISYVRAALMVASSRKEAQLQVCNIEIDHMLRCVCVCVKYDI